MVRSEDDIWVFPKEIDFEKTAQYTKKYREQKSRLLFFFDLSSTVSIHTSFIGFLITVKNEIELSDGRLILNASDEIGELFKKMKLTDFFSTSKNVEMFRKTA